MERAKRRSRIEVRFARGDIWLLGTDQRYQLADGLSIQLRENWTRPGIAAFSYDAHFLIEYAARVPLDVAAGLLSAWLYDTLRRNKATITIDRKEIEVDDKRKLKKFLKEHIEKKGPAPVEPKRSKAPVKKSKPRKVASTRPKRSTKRT
jgi:hypothetical protein